MRQPLFAERRPYLFVALLEVLIILVYLLAGTVAHFTGLSNLGLYGLANVALTILAAVILTGMRWWGVTGLRNAGRVQDLWYYLVPIVPAFLNLIPGMASTGVGQSLQILAVTLMVGFVEEAFFLGLMLQALYPRGAWKAVLVTSVIFSVTHLMNTLAGESGPEAAAQLLYTLAIGFGFAAVALRTRTLWPLIVVHCLIDLVAMHQRPEFVYPAGLEIALALGISALFVGYGLWLMRTRPAAGPVRAGAARA